MLLRFKLFIFQAAELHAAVTDQIFDFVEHVKTNP